MNNTERINYGLIGYGLNSLGHEIELKFHPKLRKNFNLIMGFDPAEKAQKKLQKKKRKSQSSKTPFKAAQSFEEALDTPDLDALIISSPPHYHADQVIAALESGLHVYSEVPMALEEKDIERIINAEDKSGKVYMLGENYSFLSEVLYAGYLSSTGKIGPVVYCESEYLHDVTYRWREGNSGDEDTPRVNAWYQKFDPLMYAHSIGPAQVAMGGLFSPLAFTEVQSYANDIGGYEGEPVCSPAKAFHVALFKSTEGAIAKCANAYIFAREPMRLIIQVSGRVGTYECYNFGKKGRLFLAKGHDINKMRHRKGKVNKVGWFRLRKASKARLGFHHGSGTRIMESWAESILNDTENPLRSRLVANSCAAGIAASKSARNNGSKENIKDYNN